MVPLTESFTGAEYTSPSGILRSPEQGTAPMPLMENEISDKDVVELSKECISLLQKIFDTMASMGAANAPKNEVSRALNEYFQQFDDKEEQKRIQREVNRIAQKELRQQIKARSELLDMFNA